MPVDPLASDTGCRAGVSCWLWPDHRQPIHKHQAQCAPDSYCASVATNNAQAGRGLMTAMAPKPLEGIRVLEMGQLIAGPFAGCLLGYFGAEVIKIESPGEGDALRKWRVVQDGTSLWWHSLARNKKSVTLNLRTDEGRALARRLALASDVLIENFRPGTMEKWGMGPEALAKDKPELVYARISGYGQTGPYASRPGFASVCEGIGGLRYVNGFPGEVPVRPNLSLGDSLAGLHAAFGILLALMQRQQPGGSGQVVDVAIYESIFNMLEAVIPEYDGAGVIREPSGSTLTGIVPTNTYRCSDGKFIVIGANGDSIFKRLMEAMDCPDAANDPRYADNPGRVEHQATLDALIEDWTKSRTADDALGILEQAAVPSGLIYNAQDMLADPHFQARGQFENVTVNGKPLKIPAIAPRLGSTPGGNRSPAPTVGEHTAEVLQSLLALSAEELAHLERDGVV
jgi:crotonobetainyl-CoA:carnitine CoA-transferase CaiB-like acyl-CoA transferase